QAGNRSRGRSQGSFFRGSRSGQARLSLHSQDGCAIAADENERPTLGLSQAGTPIVGIGVPILKMALACAVTMRPTIQALGPCGVKLQCNALLGQWAGIPPQAALLARSPLLFPYNFRKRRRCLFAYEGYTAVLNEGTEPLVLAQLQPFAARGVSGQQKCSWKSAGATQLERSEILAPVAIGHVGILGFPLGQFEQIFLGNLPFLCAIAQMGPLLSGQPLPLNLGHGFNGQ